MANAFRTSALLAALALAAVPALAQAPAPTAPAPVAGARGMTDMATTASTRGGSVTTTRPTGAPLPAPPRGTRDSSTSHP